jgi:REP element-mobilizing transposase RayT
MPYDPEIHSRRSIRLRHYDYSDNGAYFITICAQRSVFGEIADGSVDLNDAGRMVQATWFELPARYTHVELDAFCIMPDHVHAILFLHSDGSGAPGTVLDKEGKPPRRASLGEIIGGFKSMTTVAYIKGVRCLGWEAFRDRLWQRSYYEHVIRSEEALIRVREYIADNPLDWASSPEYPGRQA